MAWVNNEIYTFPEMHNKVHLHLKRLILIAFLVVYQFAGGVYMAAGSHMSGSLSLLREDIMMAGYASLIGLSLTFTIMYRLKFSYTIKTSMIASATGLIVCNIISLFTTNVVLLVAVGFFSGVFKMWGTFACNVTLVQWLFPKWDMAKFQSCVQTMVMSLMVLSGLTTVYLSYFIQWEYMHLLMIGLLCLLVTITAFIFKHHRVMKKKPLYGIDWVGAVLWAITGLSVVFILNYGEYYDWFSSFYINMGALIGLMAIGLNVWRATFVKRPYVENIIWSFNKLRRVFLLLIVVYILMGPSYILEHIFSAAILHYDELNIISFNWISLIGYFAGGFVGFQAFALRNWRVNTMIVLAFILMVSHLIFMYLIIDYNLPKYALYIPIFLRCMGAIMVPMTLLTYLIRNIPFMKFFQSVTIFSMISTCCGPLFGVSIVNKMFQVAMKKNELFFSSNLDRVNSNIRNVPLGQLYGALKEHAILVGMKEVYGWLSIVGIACIFLLLLRESDFHPIRLIRAKSILLSEKR